MSNPQSIPTRDRAAGKQPTRIVVFADSLALPRGTELHEEIVYWENTWPVVLEKTLLERGYSVDVINCGARDRTSESLSSAQFYEHVELKRPDVLIVQVGVADCAPRVFSRFEKRLLGLPFVPAGLRDRIIRHRSARRAELTRRKPLAKVYVPLPLFRQSLDAFAQKLRGLAFPPAVVFVPIVGWPEQMDAKSPGFSDNVRLYNQALEEFVARSDFAWLPWSPSGVDFWIDGHHLSGVGNRTLATLLADLLVDRKLISKFEF